MTGFNSDVFCTTPAVFVVKDTYHVMVCVQTEVLFWVEVNGKAYYSHTNGILRSNTRVHRAVVPMKELDAAGAYTLCYRRVLSMGDSFPVTGQVEKAEFKFRPIPSEGKVNIYQISDAHQIPELPNRAGRFFGKELHLLVLNGDIVNKINAETDFDYIYQLIQDITKGEIPVIFSKGNHDSDGYCGEFMERYAPVYNGRSYYTFRLGNIWGLVLDGGQYLNDDHPVFGNKFRHRELRIEEAEYIKEVIKNAEEEYEAPDIQWRIIICHIPYTHVQQPPCDVDPDIFSQWNQLINTHIKPHFVLSGHLHSTVLSYPGSSLDTLGQGCPVIVGAKHEQDQGQITNYIGCALTLDKPLVNVRFTDANHKIHFDETFSV